jgi:hypothetical protein
VIINPNAGRDYVSSYYRRIFRIPGNSIIELYVCRAVYYRDRLFLFSKLVGTQALQVIENINYLLDCHAGGRGFESRPLR